LKRRGAVFGVDATVTIYVGESSIETAPGLEGFGGQIVY